MIAPRTLWKHVALGFVSGVVISLMPLELMLLVVPGLLIAGMLAAKRRPPGSALTSYALAGIAGLGAICLAILLPVKQLDGRVGPIHYDRMSLDDLCQALTKNDRVFVRAPYPQGTNIFLAFHTDRAMPRREVLQKLADDAACDLRIGFCGSGATILFGAHPSFTGLHIKAGQPDGAANRGGRVDSRTNRRAAAAGSGG